MKTPNISGTPRTENIKIANWLCHYFFLLGLLAQLFPHRSLLFARGDSQAKAFTASSCVSKSLATDVVNLSSAFPRSRRVPCVAGKGRRERRDRLQEWGLENRTDSLRGLRRFAWRTERRGLADHSLRSRVRS